uniref:Uncharacterized protein n=1 Tax=Clytia hemisphaerica TaxID=252671 RepID=A0A7M5WTQ7_9CNID
AGEQIAANYENWLRLMTLIHYVGFEICKNILHNIEKLPVNGAQLYLALFRRQREFNKLLRKQVLHQDQFDLIFPANGSTDITQFDITLFSLVITVMFGKKKYKVIVNELKKWRNEEFHQGEILMNQVDFNAKWNAFLLLATPYGVNVGKFVDLKTCAMDKISQHNNRFIYA